MVGVNFVGTLYSFGATLSFTMPLTPGTYQLRFFLQNSYTVLATSPTTMPGIEIASGMSW